MQPGIGHVPMSDDPAEVGRLILEMKASQGGEPQAV